MTGPRGAARRGGSRGYTPVDRRPCSLSVVGLRQIARSLARFFLGGTADSRVAAPLRGFREQKAARSRSSSLGFLFRFRFARRRRDFGGFLSRERFRAIWRRPLSFSATFLETVGTVSLCFRFYFACRRRDFGGFFCLPSDFSPRFLSPGRFLAAIFISRAISRRDFYLPSDFSLRFFSPERFLAAISISRAIYRRDFYLPSDFSRDLTPPVVVFETIGTVSFSPFVSLFVKAILVVFCPPPEHFSRFDVTCCCFPSFC